MYKKFNYVLGADATPYCSGGYLEIGKKIYDVLRRKSEDCLDKYILPNGHVAATALKEHWFGSINAHVFISHSRKDLDKVKAFAGWLYHKFGLISFIDSCVWGYCDDLLRKIDNRFCKQPNKDLYDYQSRNCSTSHIHAMLSIALGEMIDETECLIFFNTPNSIDLKKEITEANLEKKVNTHSPWIYHELSMSGMLRKNIPERYKTQIALESMQEKHHSTGYDDLPSFDFEVSEKLADMIRIDDNTLKKWEGKFGINIKQEKALDELYKICKDK